MKNTDGKEEKNKRSLKPNERRGSESVKDIYGEKQSDLIEKTKLAYRIHIELMPLGKA